MQENIDDIGAYFPVAIERVAVGQSVSFSFEIFYISNLIRCRIHDSYYK